MVVCSFSPGWVIFLYLSALLSQTKATPVIYHRGRTGAVNFLLCGTQDKTVQLESNRRDCLFALWAKSFALAVQTCLRSDFPQTHKTQLIFSKCRTRFLFCESALLFLQSYLNGDEMWVGSLRMPTPAPPYVKSGCGTSAHSDLKSSVND